MPRHAMMPWHALGHAVVCRGNAKQVWPQACIHAATRLWDWDGTGRYWAKGIVSKARFVDGDLDAFELTVKFDVDGSFEVHAHAYGTRTHASTAQARETDTETQAHKERKGGREGGREEASERASRRERERERERERCA